MSSPRGRGGGWGGEPLGEGRHVPTRRGGDQGLRGQGAVVRPAAIVGEAGGARGRRGRRRRVARRRMAVVLDEGGRSLHALLTTVRHCRARALPFLDGVVLTYPGIGWWCRACSSVASFRSTYGLGAVGEPWPLPRNELARVLRPR
jgi:hypothetical protein